MSPIDPIPAIEARAVTKTYRPRSGSPMHAVHEVSLSLAPGSLTVLTGASGSGKSTLLALLGALEIPTSGEVLIFGQSLSRSSDTERARIRRRVGFVFQRFELLPRLAVWENVSYPLIPRGVGRVERYRRAVALLDEVGLGGRERSRPEELSGGEQQRVAVARALVGEPEVLIADEPVSNLDPENAALVMELLLNQHRKGVTLVLALHNLTAVSANAAIMEMKKGRIESRDAKTGD